MTDDALAFLVLLGIGAAVSAVVAIVHFLQSRRLRRAIGKLASDPGSYLGEGARARTSFWLARNEFRLRIGSRAARVSFFASNLTSIVRFELDVDEAVRIGTSRRATALRSRPQPASGAGLGLDGLPFTFATLDRPKVERAFAANRGLRDDLVAIYEQGADALMIWSGKLTATLSVAALEPEDFRPLLERLDRIARSFERIPLPVRVLGGERRALRGASGGARCALCHDGITGDEPDLVACERCQTILHESCWTDLGRCPVLGCDGHDPERAARARA